MNQDDANKIIEEGLKAIDEETKTDEEIREISRLLKDELAINTYKGLETHVTDLNGNWNLIFDIEYDMKFDNEFLETLLELGTIAGIKSHDKNLNS